MSSIPRKVVATFLFFVQKGASIRDHIVTLNLGDPIKNGPVATGRGYSLSTGRFFDTCVDGDFDSPAYADFDFFVTEIDNRDPTPALRGKISQYGSYIRLSEMVTENLEPSPEYSDGYPLVFNNTKFLRHFYAATYAIDRYFKEDSDPEYTEEAIDMIKRGHYTKFFEVCGPTYVHSTRRSSEATFVFVYYSPGLGPDPWYSRAIQKAIRGARIDETGMKNYFLHGKMFTLGLEMGQTDMPFAGVSVGEMADLMESVHASMQNPATGIVRSIEVRPFVADLSFSGPARLSTDMFALDLDDTGKQKYCRGAGCSSNTVDATCHTTIESECDVTLSINNRIPATYECKDEINCPNQCMPAADCIPLTAKKVTIPMRKFNLMENAEFIATIDRKIQDMLIFVHKYQRCNMELMRMGSDLDDDLLINHKMYLDGSNPITVSVKQLRYRLTYGETCDASTACDITTSTNYNTNTAYVSHTLQRQMLTYLKNFANPCFDHMNGEYNGVWGGTVQMRHWSETPVCSIVSCSLPNTYYAPDAELGSECAAHTQGITALMATVEEYCDPVFRSDLDGTKHFF